MPRVSAVKAAIEQVFCPAGYSKSGWGALRRAALVPPGRHTCTPDQERRLWIAASLRRAKPQNQPVTPAEVSRLWVACGGDLRKILTGYVPALPDLSLLPASVEGWELPGIIEQWTNYRPGDSRLRDWCQRLGFRYSRLGCYSGSQILELLALWRQLRAAERDRARRQASKNFHRQT